MSPTKKIAILAAFPLHHLTVFGEKFRPVGHYATWLPQIAEAWGEQNEFEIHWVVMSDLVDERKDVSQWGQIFHILPTTQSGRASTLFRTDRKAIGVRRNSHRPAIARRVARRSRRRRRNPRQHHLGANRAGLGAEGGGCLAPSPGQRRAAAGLVLQLLLCGRTAGFARSGCLCGGQQLAGRVHCVAAQPGVARDGYRLGCLGSDR